MKQFLEHNAPWSQLVALGNIELVLIEPNKPIQLSPAIQVTPMLVPHRDEFSETVDLSYNQVSEVYCLFQILTNGHCGIEIFSPR